MMIPIEENFFLVFVDDKQSPSLKSMSGFVSSKKHNLQDAHKAIANSGCDQEQRTKVKGVELTVCTVQNFPF